MIRPLAEGLDVESLYSDDSNLLQKAFNLVKSLCYIPEYVSDSNLFLMDYPAINTGKQFNKVADLSNESTIVLIFSIGDNFVLLHKHVSMNKLLQLCDHAWHFECEFSIHELVGLSLHKLYWEGEEDLLGKETTEEVKGHKVYLYKSKYLLTYCCED